MFPEGYIQLYRERNILQCYSKNLATTMNGNKSEVENKLQVFKREYQNHNVCTCNNSDKCSSNVINMCYYYCVQCYPCLWETLLVWGNM